MKPKHTHKWVATTAWDVTTQKRIAIVLCDCGATLWPNDIARRLNAYENRPMYRRIGWHWDGPHAKRKSGLYVRIPKTRKKEKKP